MEFDKSRVYTSLNADELRAGDKVIVANCISMIKAILVEGIQKNIKEINEILGEGYSERFHVGNNDYALAYLVERKKNCTNCDEGKKDGDYWLGCTPDKFGKEEQAKCWCCEDWKPKTEEKWCKNCGVEVCSRAGVDADVRCPAWQPKAEKHADYNHCEEARKVCAMTNVCPNKHYRPFRGTDELIKVWNAKIGTPKWGADGDLTMPHIWVQRKDKSTGASQHLITSLNIPILRNEQWTNGVSVESTSITFEALFRLYEFLDGSPCGVEE